MAVGTYKLPICDGCKLPWLPVGWTLESDPRTHVGKPLRCGKCKSIGWDKEYTAALRKEATELAVNPFDPTKTIEMPRNVALNEALEHVDVPRGTPQPQRTRCKHRMTDCPICSPKEAA